MKENDPMIPYIRRQMILDYMSGKEVVYLKEMLYFGFFGEGHNVTMDWLSRNGCWPNGGYPTSYVLSRAQFEQILREAGVDVENVIINQA